jgi:hypothetical protein
VSADREDSEPDELPSALRASRPEPPAPDAVPPALRASGGADEPAEERERPHEPDPGPRASDDAPEIDVQGIAPAPPKKQTLKLFPFSGDMGAAPAADAGLTARKTPPRAPPSPSRRGDPRLDPDARNGKETPLVTRAARRTTPGTPSDRPAGRLKGPAPKDPAVVLAALEPHLAWMAEDLRPSLFKQIMCGHYDSAVASLQEHRQRYPRNLTIAKAIEVAEDAAASKLLHDLGPTTCEVIVIGAEARTPLSPNFAALLRLARQAATLEELLDKSPLGRFRTLQLVTQLVQDGMLAFRAPARGAGFGKGSLSTPSFEAVARRVGQSPSGAHEAHTPAPPRIDPRADLDASDLPERAPESLGVMDRATLPDPGEVAVHLERLRQARIDSPTPSELPAASSQPKLLALLDRLEGEAVAATAPVAEVPPPAAPVRALQAGATSSETPPEPATRVSPEADEPPATAKSTESEARADSTPPAAQTPGRARASSPPGPSEDDDQPPSKRRALETSPELAAELKRLRPREIREADREGALKLPTLVMGLAAIAVLVSGVSLYVTLGAKPDPVAAPPAPDPRPAPPPSGPAPIPSSQPSAATAPSAPAPTASTTELESVTLEVEVSPYYAQVYLDGTLLTKPFRVGMVRDAREHELRIEAGGHKSQRRTFVVKGDRSFVIALEPIVGRRPDGPPPEPTSSYD